MIDRLRIFMQYILHREEYYNIEEYNDLLLLDDIKNPII